MKGYTIICTNCRERFKAFKNGVPVGELDSSGKIFRVWFGDILYCPNCGFKVISRLAEKPVHEECNPKNHNPEWKNHVEFTFY